VVSYITTFLPDIKLAVESFGEVEKSLSIFIDKCLNRDAGFFSRLYIFQSIFIAAGQKEYVLT